MLTFGFSAFRVVMRRFGPQQTACTSDRVDVTCDIASLTTDAT